MSEEEKKKRFEVDPHAMRRFYIWVSIFFIVLVGSIVIVVVAIKNSKEKRAERDKLERMRIRDERMA